MTILIMNKAVGTLSHVLFDNMKITEPCSKKHEIRSAPYLKLVWIKGKFRFKWHVMTTLQQGSQV